MRKVRVFQLVGTAVALLFLLAACAPGMSIEMMEEMQAEIEDVNSRISAIEQDLGRLEQADEDELADTAAETVGSLQEEISMIASTLSNLESQFDEFLAPPPADEAPMPADQPADF